MANESRELGCRREKAAGGPLEPAALRPIESHAPVLPLRSVRSGEILAVHTFTPDTVPDEFALSGALNFELAFGPEEHKPRPEMKTTVAHVARLVNRAEPLLDVD